VKDAGFHMDVGWVRLYEAPVSHEIMVLNKSLAFRTLTTMVGLRRSSIGRIGALRLRPLESEYWGSSSWQLLFNDASEVGVRMPDLDRDASECRAAWEDILMQNTT
jgi:hypothetical protein